MPKKLDNDECNRLFQHMIHEEDIFNTHHNFFLVFESVLMGVVAMLLSAPMPNLSISLIVSILGLTSTLVWSYQQIKMKWILGLLRARARANLLEYEQTMAEREKRRWLFSNTWLLTYIVPTIIGFIWITLIVYIAR